MSLKQTQTCFDGNLSNRPRCIVANRNKFWIQVHSQNLHEFSYNQIHSEFSMHKLVLIQLNHYGLTTSYNSYTNITQKYLLYISTNEL